MTLPDERTLAVLRARDFLVRLSNVYTPRGIKGIRTEVRQEARAILRHFPQGFDMTGKEAFDESVVNEWYERNAK